MWWARVQKRHLANMKNCQNRTFKPVHEIQNFFLYKSILLKHSWNSNKKKYHNMPQGPPNTGYMEKKVQKRDFEKKWPLRELKDYFHFRCLWIPWTHGRVNYKRLVFLPSKNLYRQCLLPNCALVKIGLCNLSSRFRRPW